MEPQTAVGISELELREWMQLAGFNLETGFLKEFADGSLNWFFTCLDFSAGEFPTAVKMSRFSSQFDPDPVAVSDDHDGDRRDSYLPRTLNILASLRHESRCK